MDQQIIVAGFPITNDMGLRRYGEFNGVRYEIVNHGRTKHDFVGGEMVVSPGPGTWCYYVIVSEAMLPPELFAEFWLEPSSVEPHRSGFPRIAYGYYAAKFAQVDWHGGVTFYEKSGGIDGAQRYVKIGCDFAHLWDEGREFDYAQVEQECIETIRQLQAMYPFRRRCPYYGTYHDQAEMVEYKGRLYAKEGVEAMTRESCPAT